MICGFITMCASGFCLGYLCNQKSLILVFRHHFIWGNMKMALLEMPGPCVLKKSPKMYQKYSQAWSKTTWMIFMDFNEPWIRNQHLEFNVLYKYLYMRSWYSQLSVTSRAALEIALGLLTDWMCKNEYKILGGTKSRHGLVWIIKFRGTEDNLIRETGWPTLSYHPSVHFLFS